MEVRAKGVICLVTSALFYSLFGVFSRLISDSFGPFSQNWTRGLVIVFLCFIVGSFSKGIKRIARKDIKWFAVIGISTAVLNPLFFVATNNLLLSTALFIFYSAIVLTTYLLGWVLLGEKINTKKLLALILSILGLFLILNTTLRDLKLSFAIIAFLSGSFYSLFATASKKVSKNYSSAFINLVSYVIVVFINLGISLMVKDKMSFDLSSCGVLYNFVFAFVVVAAFLLVVQGFKYIEAQKGSLILLSELIFVMINGYLFYREVPDFASVLGGVLILFAMILPLFDIKFKR